MRKLLGVGSKQSVLDIMDIHTEECMEISNGLYRYRIE